MAAVHRWLKSFRTLHLYLGVFTAPALLFLAFTGALQSVNLHEAARGGDYKPPAWIASIAHMHKKQSFDVPVKRGPPNLSIAHADAVPKANAAARANDKRSTVPAERNLWPMKIFFVLVSLSLILSTVTGIYMGWRYTRNRRRYGATLAVGVAVPALLLLF
ncbi:MAG TPA: PepSY domain-containing protein [Rhodanobacteraceae bacterium]|nr:PepSY domain-containing protein [Rhodanobacteraceae bacterium]